jgi:hypothetical protein
MSESVGRKPFSCSLAVGEGALAWSLGGRFTAGVSAAEAEERFALGYAPRGLGPVAGRYGTEVVGPPRRAH